MEIKNKKRMLEIKNILTEMKNVFQGPISRFCRERISTFENMKMDTSKTEKQINKYKTQKQILKNPPPKEQNIKHYGTITKGLTYVKCEYRKERKQKQYLKD